MGSSQTGIFFQWMEDSLKPGVYLWPHACELACRAAQALWRRQQRKPALGKSSSRWGRGLAAGGGVNKKNIMESSFQKGGKWKKKGRSNSARVKVKRGEQLLSPALILTEFFSEMPMFFEHIDSVTLFSCLNSLLGRVKFNPNLFLGSVLFCIPSRSEGNRKDKWCDNHRPHKKKKTK